MIRLRREQILQMHEELIERFGGSPGIRDEALLDAALAAPFQEFAGEECFPTLQAKAARLGFGLVKNHAMVDGNKRIGAHAMLVFLALNGVELEYTQEELYGTILRVADDSCSCEELTSWINEHQK